MGASREALFSMLAEPAFFILMGSLGLLTGFTSFNAIFQALHFGSYITYALGIIATFILLMLTMIENSRMPVDDPKTHLETYNDPWSDDFRQQLVFDLGLIFQATNFKFVLYGMFNCEHVYRQFAFICYIPLFFAIQIAFGISIGWLNHLWHATEWDHNAQFVLILSSLSLLVYLVSFDVLNKFNSW